MLHVTANTKSTKTKQECDTVTNHASMFANTFPKETHNFNSTNFKKSYIRYTFLKVMIKNVNAFFIELLYSMSELG